MQWTGRARTRRSWPFAAPGVGIGGLLCGALVVVAGTGDAHAQSLTPPTIAVVQAAVTTPPTLPQPGSLTPPSAATVTNTIASNTPSTIASTTPNASKPAASSTVSATTKYSDPLSDMASAALDALRNGGLPGSVQMFASVQAPVVTSVKGTPLTRPTASSADATWSSVVIDTAQLSDYLSGTAVVAPVSPTISAALAALPTEPAARYSATLRSLASLVAKRSKVDAASLEAVWLRTDVRRMRTILTAMAQVGTMYKAAGNQPGGFDCSGLTSYAWAQAGVKIPRTSTDQINAAAPRSPDQLLPGDVIWHPGHIGLYLGVGDAMVHSPQTGKPVEVRGWGKAQRWGSPV